MMEFLKRHALASLVVALAILLVSVITAISYAYNRFGWLGFFVSWVAIGISGGFLLIKVVDVYERLEINSFQKSKDNKFKSKNHGEDRKPKDINAT